MNEKRYILKVGSYYLADIMTENEQLTNYSIDKDYRKLYSDFDIEYNVLLNKDSYIGKNEYQLFIDKHKRLFELVDKMLNNVNCWLLGCNISLEAAEIAYKAMSGGKNEN